MSNFAKSEKHLCQSLFFRHEACNFIKKVIVSQVFFCEFCEIFNNTHFAEHPRQLLLNIEKETKIMVPRDN